ncbi:unnamed protein product [Protopolystoma xenopodis]|uniref:Uncharacterized protein n=1 Tax=Protopolystoma xenopodis TaxID=117903 RepID=A0A3S5CGW5_9PLAT|nr:unnamed protein product [Protopolystoma xenopodis]
MFSLSSSPNNSSSESESNNLIGGQLKSQVSFSTHKPQTPSTSSFVDTLPSLQFSASSNKYKTFPLPLPDSLDLEMGLPSLLPLWLCLARIPYEVAREGVRIRLSEHDQKRSR